MKPFKNLSIFILATVSILSFSNDVANAKKNIKSSNIQIELQKEKNTEIQEFCLDDYQGSIVTDTNRKNIQNEVWMWGRNNAGQLGDGTNTRSDVPVQVQGLPEGKVLDIDLGAYSSGVVIDTNYDGKGDEVWMWGSNGNNELGDGTRNNSNVPVQVQGLPENVDIQKINIGDYHAGVLIDTLDKNSKDEIWMWGKNFGSTASKLDYTSGNNIIDFETSNLSSGISVDLDDNGTADEIWMWGSNSNGALGNGGTFSGVNNYSVVSLPEDSTIKEFAAGGYFSGAILEINNKEQVWMWGDNNYGQLGDGSTTDSNIPVQVQGFSENAEIKNLSLGDYHASVSVTENRKSKIFSWGSNNKGQLGDGSLTDSTIPIELQGLENQDDVIDISYGLGISGVSIDTNNNGNANEVWMWGNNGNGELGINDATIGYSTVPVKVQFYSPSKNAKIWWIIVLVVVLVILSLLFLLLLFFLYKEKDEEENYNDEYYYEDENYYNNEYNDEQYYYNDDQYENYQ